MRYDIVRLDGGLVLDVQNDLLDGLNTRVVAPLLPTSDAPRPALRLNPVLKVGNEDVVMMTQFLAAVSVHALGNAIANLTDEHDGVVAALDMLFQGF